MEVIWSVFKMYCLTRGKTTLVKLENQAITGLSLNTKLPKHYLAFLSKKKKKNACENHLGDQNLLMNLDQAIKRERLIQKVGTRNIQF